MHATSAKNYYYINNKSCTIDRSLRVRCTYTTRYRGTADPIWHKRRLFQIAALCQPFRWREGCIVFFRIFLQNYTFLTETM